jgi:hypothetical protein
VTELLVGLRIRGLDTNRPIVVSIDGGKALHAAVGAVRLQGDRSLPTAQDPQNVATSCPTTSPRP